MLDHVEANIDSHAWVLRSTSLLESDCVFEPLLGLVDSLALFGGTLFKGGDGSPVIKAEDVIGCRYPAPSSLMCVPLRCRICPAAVTARGCSFSSAGVLTQR